MAGESGTGQALPTSPKSPTSPTSPTKSRGGGDFDDVESVEQVLFSTKECYVYQIPPRKTAASYRADEWDINKWSWEGALKVIAKGSECSIRLEDVNTGELFALAPVEQGKPVPVETVIDSSRYFVLRIVDTSASHRHAFIGIGFRERPTAYDFQAALHDHLGYLQKKKEAEEMVKDYASRPTTDYSIKEGQKIRLEIKTSSKKLQMDGSSSHLKAATRSLSGLAVKSGVPFLPPPPGSQTGGPLSIVVDGQGSLSGTQSPSHSRGMSVSSSDASADDADFGDFQAA